MRGCAFCVAIQQALQRDLPGEQLAVEIERIWDQYHRAAGLRAKYRLRRRMRRYS